MEYTAGKILVVHGVFRFFGIIYEALCKSEAGKPRIVMFMDILYNYYSIDKGYKIAL